MIAESEIAQIERLYDAEVATLDDHVGKLLGELKRLDLEESTLVVLLADHGEEMSEHGLLGHGESLHEEVLWVPLILRLQGISIIGSWRLRATT